MKKLYFAFTFIYFVLSINAQSPITITSTQMPISNDSARYSNIVLSSLGNYTLTGANYNWDFSLVDTSGQGVRWFQPSTATPYYFYFFPPKYGEKIADSVPLPTGSGFSIKNIYSFYRKNSTLSFNSEGMGLTMNGIPIGATFSDEDELYFFPLNYGDRDSSTFKLSTPTNTAIPFAYKKQGYRITEADGWGSITTPYGTAACLRVVTTQYSQDTITINALPPGFNKFGFPNYQRSYQWLTLTQKIPYLEISGTVNGTNFTANQARYRDNLPLTASLINLDKHYSDVIFPNPATQEVTIITNGSEKQIMVSISDLQGKTVKSYAFEQGLNTLHEQKLNVSDLSKGIYILNVSDGKTQQSTKISIQ